MVERIVKMYFREDKVEEFNRIFKDSKDHIRNASGCVHLELWRDIEDDTVFYTYSKWERPEDLEGYRHSELFLGVWAETKVLFREKPEAVSAERYD